MANRVPEVGRIALSPMLNERGRLIGDFTLCRIAEERVLLVGTYAAEKYYLRWFADTRAGRGCRDTAVRHGVCRPIGRRPEQPCAVAATRQ